MTGRPCEVCNGSRFGRHFKRQGLDYVRCRSCHLVRADPPPTDEELAEVYGPRYHTAWGSADAADRGDELKMATFRRHILPYAGLRPGMRMLDCGAALGAMMAAAEHAGLDAYGIESSPTAAAAIAARFGSDRVYSGRFEDAAFPGIGPEAFDAVIMCDFIEHVRDPLAVLHKAVSLLRPHGRIVLTTPDAGSVSCRLMGPLWPHYKVEHLYFFDRRNIVDILGQAGVTVTTIGVARKVLDVAYLRHHFEAYPRPLVTPALGLMARLGGAWVDRRSASLSLGEMIVAGTKR